MSRSSKGFADFFPTAPSVLQQKRSRHKESEKTRRPASPPPRHRNTHNTDHSSPSLPEPRFTDGEPQGSCDNTEQTPRSTDDIGIINGDLLNGVGSASSTSTTSSLFDTSRAANYVNGEGQISKSLTPLTNIDLSPPGYTTSMNADRKYTSFDHQKPHQEDATSKSRARHNHVGSSAMDASTTAAISAPRSGKVEPKGERLVYDPELDRKLDRDRSKRKVLNQKLEYRSFDHKVRSLLSSLTCACKKLS